LFNTRRMKKILSMILSVILLVSVTALPALAEDDTATAPRFTVQGNTNEEKAASIVSQMSLEEKIGQMLMLDVRNWNGPAQTVLTPECAQMIKDYHIGGIILFAPNFVNPTQIVTLTDAMQHAAIDGSNFNIPLFLSADQEGGYIVRLTTSGTVMPGNMAVGAAASTELAYDNGRVIGEELNALGINVNFAPVLDVNTNPDNPVIGVRSFGSDPQLVSDMGIEYIHGLQSANIGVTVKHFPGHGDTGTDTHTSLAIVNKSRDELDVCDLKPFRDAMNQGVDMVMTAHIEVPALDDTKILAPKNPSNEIYIPATLSQKVLTDLVREEIGFEGVIVTDALNMGALANNFYSSDIVIRAINAGADIPLMPVTTQSTANISNLQQLINDLVQAVNNGDIPMSRIDESVTRILKVKMDRNIYDPDAPVQPAIAQPLEDRISYAGTVLRSPEHLATEINIADHAVTLAKNDDGMLPFDLKAGDSVLIMSPSGSYNRNNILTNSINAILAEKGLTGQVAINTIAYATGSGAAPTADDKAKMDAATHIILGSMIYNAASRKLPNGYANYPNEAVKYANSQNKKIADISLGLPYELSYMTEVKALVNTYCLSGNANVQNYKSAIKAIFGLINPTGKYPVDVPHPNPDAPNPFIREVGDGLSYPSVVEASIASVSATNGTVNITLTVKPTVEPSAEDFTATVAIDDGTVNTLALTDFSYDGNITVTYNFTQVEQTAAAQSVVVAVRMGTDDPVAADAFTVEALPNTPPEVKTGLEQTASEGGPSIVLAPGDLAADADGDILILARPASDDEAVVTAAIVDDKLEITIVGPGSANVTVEVSDGKAAITVTVPVTVHPKTKVIETSFGGQLTVYVDQDITLSATTLKYSSDYEDHWAGAEKIDTRLIRNEEDEKDYYVSTASFDTSEEGIFQVTYSITMPDEVTGTTFTGSGTMTITVINPDEVEVVDFEITASEFVKQGNNPEQDNKYQLVITELLVTHSDGSTVTVILEGNDVIKIGGFKPNETDRKFDVTYRGFTKQFMMDGPTEEQALEQ
jgi:beta-N-acetylhexosaminidase